MKFFCIGRNYADHAKELGNPVPTTIRVEEEKKIKTENGVFPKYFEYKYYENENI